MENAPNPKPLPLSRSQTIGKIVEETQRQDLRKSLCLKCVHATIMEMAEVGENNEPLLSLTIICNAVGKEITLPIRRCTDYERIEKTE